MFAQGPVGQDHGDSNFAANEDLALGVWAEGAAEDVLHEEFFDVLRLRAGPLHRRFAELDGRDIGESCRTAS